MRLEERFPPTIGIAGVVAWRRDELLEESSGHRAIAYISESSYDVDGKLYVSLDLENLDCMIMFDDSNNEDYSEEFEVRGGRVVIRSSQRREERGDIDYNHIPQIEAREELLRYLPPEFQTQLKLLYDRVRLSFDQLVDAQGQYFVLCMDPDLNERIERDSAKPLEGDEETEKP